MRNITHVEGDLIEMSKLGHFDIIIHGCNCFHTMGAGIANSIRINFPEAYDADKSTSYGESNKLGKYSVALISSKDNDIVRDFLVINAYTQFKPGANFHINAFIDVMNSIVERLPAHTTVGIPMIGSGIGGGNWADILLVLEGIFDSRPDVHLTIVKYKK